MKLEKRPENVSFTTTKEIKVKLRQMAEKEDRSMSRVIERLIRDAPWPNKNK